MNQSSAFPRTASQASNICLIFGFAFILLDALWINVVGAGAVVSLGFYTFHFIDISTPLLMLFLLVSRPVFTASPGLLLVGSLLILTIISFARGVIIDPFQAAFSLRERSAYFLFALALVTSGSQRKSLNLLMPLMIIYPIALVGLFCLRSIYGAGLFLSESGLDVLESNELRLLNADGAVFLSLMGAMLFTAALQSGRGRTRTVYGATALLFIAVELITRQRTATIAAAAGFATLLLASPGLLARAPAWTKVFGGGVFACALAALVVVGPSGVYSALPNSFQRAAEKRGTLTFRQAMWAAAAKSIEDREPLDLLVGPPSGQRPEIYFLDQRWGETLHSFYVETAFDFGLLGLVVLMAAMIWGLLQLIIGLLSGAGPNSLGLEPSLCLCWFVELAIFGYSYDLRSSLSLFLFASLAATSRKRIMLSRPAARGIFANTSSSAPRPIGRQPPQLQWKGRRS